MTKTAANTNTTGTEGKANWVNRFGTLEDITDRKTAKGEDYITFKLAAKGFAVYGSCFKPEIIAEMKAAVGQRVWMNGVLEQLGTGEDARASFKAIRFKVSGDAAEAGAEAEQEKEAA